MKWKADTDRLPREWDKREVVRFAFLPIQVENKIVWLEQYLQVQVYYMKHWGDEEGRYLING